MMWTIDPELVSAGRGHGGRGAASIIQAGADLQASLRLRAEGAVLPDLLPALAADLAKNLASSQGEDPMKGFDLRRAELDRQQQAAEAKLATIQQQRDDPALLASKDLGQRLEQLDGEERFAKRVLEQTKTARHELETRRKKVLNEASVARRQRLDAAVEGLAKQALADRAALLREISDKVGPLLDRLATAEARVGLLVFDHAKVKDSVLLSSTPAEAA